MYEDLKEFVRNAWQEHPGKVVGLSVGFVLGLAVLLFGFWQILFLLVCIGGGLYVGTKFDSGDEFLHRLTRVLPEKFQRW